MTVEFATEIGNGWTLMNRRVEVVVPQYLLLPEGVDLAEWARTTASLLYLQSGPFDEFRVTNGHDGLCVEVLYGSEWLEVRER